jgi:hypothetical protein
VLAMSSFPQVFTLRRSQLLTDNFRRNAEADRRTPEAAARRFREALTSCSQTRSFGFAPLCALLLICVGTC